MPSERMRIFLLKFALGHRRVRDVADESAQSREWQRVGRTVANSEAYGETMALYNIAYGSGWLKPVTWMKKPWNEDILLTDIATLTDRGREALGLEHLVPTVPSKSDLEYSKGLERLRSGARARRAK